MSGSIQHEIDYVRKPRVHITYDVETNGAVVKKDIPFVVGILGDFSGNPTQPLKRLEDRKFVNIDRDNFNEVLATLNAALDLRVENTLEGEGEMGVHLDFKHMDDFSPERIVEQVPALKTLLESRQQLRDLLTKVDQSADLEEKLNEILANAEQMEALRGEVGSKDAGSDASAGDGDDSNAGDEE